MKTQLKAAEFCKMTGTTIKQLRIWTKKRLLSYSTHDNNYKYYGYGSICNIVDILLFRQAGMSLDDMVYQYTHNITQTNELLNNLINNLNEQILSLQQGIAIATDYQKKIDYINNNLKSKIDFLTPDFFYVAIPDLSDKNFVNVKLHSIVKDITTIIPFDTNSGKFGYFSDKISSPSNLIWQLNPKSKFIHFLSYIKNSEKYNDNYTIFTKLKTNCTFSDEVIASAPTKQVFDSNNQVLTLQQIIDSLTQMGYNPKLCLTDWIISIGEENDTRNYYNTFVEI